MPRLRKFLLGKPIVSMAQLAEEVIDKRAYVIWRGRPFHPGWIASMQFRMLSDLVRRGSLATTLLNPAWVPPHERKE